MIDDRSKTSKGRMSGSGQCLFFGGGGPQVRYEGRWTEREKVAESAKGGDILM